MIVESMPHTEVYQELARERETVTRWWRHNLWNQRRRVLKSTHFPLNLWFDYTSAHKNRYLFFTLIFDKKMKRIMTGVAVPRMMKDGMYVYTSWLADHKLIFPMVLTPHMWKRYQDPDRGNVQKSGTELIKHYFIHNTHGKDTHNNRVMARSVRWNGEEHQACCVNEGVLLGQVKDKYFLVRTFITYDMATGKQKEVFDARHERVLRISEMFNLTN